MVKFEHKKYIERELIDYEETKKLIEQEISEINDEIIYSSNIIDETGIRSSGIKRPTEKKAIQLSNRKATSWLHAAEFRIKAIDRAIARMSEEQKRLIKIKYWTSPQMPTTTKIASEMNVDDSTIRRWTKNILTLIAVEMGLM